MEVVVPRPHSHCCLLFHHTPDQMEDEALQCAEVCPAELIYYRIHSPYHLPLVWLTLGGKNNPTVRRRNSSPSGSLSQRRSGPQHDAGRSNYKLTHGPEELLVQFKGHERAGQVTEPLFEDAGNDVDVVIIQVHATHIWKRKIWVLELELAV